MRNRHILFLILSISIIYVWAGWGIGFDSDCFGFVFYVSRIKRLSQLWQALMGQIQFAYMPLNEQPLATDIHFFTYYRPLGTLVYFLCYKLCGTWACGWYLVQVLFHIMTSFCLYSIYIYLMPYTSALLSTLLFAFHPVLTPYFIGLTCCVIPVFLLLALAVLLYAQYLKKNNKLMLICSSLAYFLSLYAYEQPIIFPVILLLYLIFFRKEHIVYDSIPYSIATILYLISRYIVLGGLPQVIGTPKKSLIDIGVKIVGNWLSIIRLFFGFELIDRILAIIVIFFCVCALCCLFIQKIYYRADRHKYILFCTLSFFLASWPLFTQGPCPRYLIAALPFFILLLYEICDRRTYYAMASIGIIWGATHASVQLSCRSEYTQKRDKGLQEVACCYNSHTDKTFVLLGTLSLYDNTHFLMHSGMMQALRLFCNDPDLSVYHVTELLFIANANTAHNVTIAPINKGYFFTTGEDNDLSLLRHTFGKKSKEKMTSMGSMQVLLGKNSWQSKEVVFTFNDTWDKFLQSPDTIILSWDVINWRFIELDKTHLVDR